MTEPLVVEFTIPGNPQQQGTKVKNRYGAMYDENKNLGPWRKEAIAAARDAYPLGCHLPVYPNPTPVVVFAMFIFGRPQSHYRTGRRAGQLRESAPYYKTGAPDTDKLQRALGDALEQSRMIQNDAQIVRWFAAKIYGDQPEVRVTIGPPFGHYTTQNPAAQGTIWCDRPWMPANPPPVQMPHIQPTQESLV